MLTDGKYHFIYQRRKDTTDVYGLYWTVELTLMPSTVLDVQHYILRLLKQDANIDATNESGWRALHYAANDDCEAIIQLLINRGADLNAKARDSGLLELQH